MAAECQLAAKSFSDEQAAEGFAVTDELRACFLPRPASASSAVPQSAEEQQAEPADLLQLLPPDLLPGILSHLETSGLASLAATCPSLWRDAPTPPPPPRAIGPVEAELRQRAEARGLEAGSSLPEGASSWVSYLLANDRRDALRRHDHLAAGSMHRISIFVDREGRLLTCGREMGVRQHFLGHAVDSGTPAASNRRAIGLPTLVPSMLGTRVVSVATGSDHCLALTAEGEVYSWGERWSGQLGHADKRARTVPSLIESLSHIESITTGPNYMSAAIDENGHLYTWGCAFFTDESDKVVGPSVLGYEIDPGLKCQPTPKRVDALSQHRVVGVALGDDFTLAVADAGDVFSFGCGEGGEGGALRHGSSQKARCCPGGSMPWRKQGGGSSRWPPEAVTPSR